MNPTDHHITVAVAYIAAGLIVLATILPVIARWLGA